MRHYVRAAELKRAGLDWKQASLPEGLPRKTQLVAQLWDDDSYGSEEERAQVFVSLGAGCRATYFNHARRLRDLRGLANDRWSRADEVGKGIPVPR